MDNQELQQLPEENGTEEQQQYINGLEETQVVVLDSDQFNEILERWDQQEEHLLVISNNSSLQIDIFSFATGIFIAAICITLLLKGFFSFSD